MSEKEKTISSLVFRLAMTGLIAGVAIGAFAAFRESEVHAIVSAVESLYWILGIFLSVQLVVSFIRRLQVWRELLKADVGETVVLLIGTSIFGTVLAGVIFMVPVVSIATLMQSIGPWEILPELHAALAWREYAVVLAATTIAAGWLAVWFYRNFKAQSDA